MNVEGGYSPQEKADISAASICDCGLHNDRETACTCSGRYNAKPDGAEGYCSERGSAEPKAEAARREQIEAQP